MKKYRKYMFRDYQHSTSLGIIVFLSKHCGKESLERLFHGVFRVSYPKVRQANFHYFDSEN